MKSGSDACGASADNNYMARHSVVCVVRHGAVCVVRHGVFYMAGHDAKARAHSG